MAYDRFLVAPINTGMQKDLQSWLIPDDAYARLDNMYLWRGRLRKRFGSRYMQADTTPTDVTAQLQSRLRIQVGTFGVPLSPVPTLSGSIGQMFSIGEVIFTVNALGAPAALLVANGSAGVATFNTVTGAFVFAAVLDSGGIAIPAGTAIYFYPALPVMGLMNYEIGAINDEPIFAFDTRFAYRFDATGWERQATETVAGAATWTGTDSQFFWGTTFRGTDLSQRLLFVTNNNSLEPNFMRVWDNISWDNFRPAFGPNAADFVDSARLIVPFKNRLVLLNTFENGSSYPNRIRWSQIGDPLNPTAFFENPPDPAVYGTNAPFGGELPNLGTSEAIISCEFVKDRLIVFYEKSTWELVYQGNEIYPFRWQKINTELGVESTFSVVPFDQVALGIGQVGIHSCNGANVQRIDQKIPDEVFGINNNDNGLERVNGIRDYNVEMVYWAYTDTENESNYFPNRVFVYNYKTGSWAMNHDSITAMGYYYQRNNATWGSTLTEWQNMGDPWVSGFLQARARQVVAGNQEGYVFEIEPDLFRNVGALQITDIDITTNELTVINHNLNSGDYVLIENAEGVTEFNDSIFSIKVIDIDTIELQNAPTPLLPYEGGGTIARVSKIDVISKQYNPYIDKGMNVSLGKIDFCVDRTDEGVILVNFYVSSSLTDLAGDGVATGSLIGDSTIDTSPYPIYPLEATQDRLWHPVYFQAQGQNVQFQLTMNDAMMTTNNISLDNIQVNGFCLYTSPITRLQ